MIHEVYSLMLIRLTEGAKNGLDMNEVNDAGVGKTDE